MNFLRRNRFSLLFVAVVALSSLLILNQHLANESGHVRMREDFLLLHFQGHAAEASHLYQRLVPSISHLQDLALIRDQDRLELAALLHPEMNVPENLLYKLRAAVRVELERRAPGRVAQALERAGLKPPPP
jgi:hypothetical protein